MRTIEVHHKVLTDVKDKRNTAVTPHINDSVSLQFKKEKEQVWCNGLHDNTSYQP